MAYEPKLALKLKWGGRLFVREPLRFISRDEVTHLLEDAGLASVDARQTEIKTQGQVLEAIYLKPA